eukprot:280986_1
MTFWQQSKVFTSTELKCAATLAVTVVLLWVQIASSWYSTVDYTVIKRISTKPIHSMPDISKLKEIVSIKLLNRDIDANMKNNTRKIPYVIYQTWKYQWDAIPTLVKNTIIYTKKQHPQYDLYYFDDIAMEQFMELYYGRNSLHSLDSHVTSTSSLKHQIYCSYKLLSSRTAKADLFRAVILRLFGGVYMDIDTYVKSNYSLNEFIQINDSFVAIWDQYNQHVAQNILITQPFHPFIHVTILNIIENVYVNKRIPTTFQYYAFNLLRIKQSQKCDFDSIFGCKYNIQDLKELLYTKENSTIYLKASETNGIDLLTGPAVLQQAIENIAIYYDQYSENMRQYVVRIYWAPYGNQRFIYHSNAYKKHKVNYWPYTKPENIFVRINECNASTQRTICLFYLITSVLFTNQICMWFP